MPKIPQPPPVEVQPTMSKIPRSIFKARRQRPWLAPVSAALGSPILDHELPIDEKGKFLAIDEHASYSSGGLPSARGKGRIRDDRALLAVVNLHACKCLLDSVVPDCRTQIALCLNRRSHAVLSDDEIDALISGYFRGLDQVPPFTKDLGQEVLKWNGLEMSPFHRPKLIDAALKLTKD